MDLCTGTNCIKEAVGYRLSPKRQKIPLCKEHFNFCWRHFEEASLKMKLYQDEPLRGRPVRLSYSYDGLDVTTFQRTNHARPQAAQGAPRQTQTDQARR